MTSLINFENSLTALDIEQQIENIPMNKENAIKLLVISKILASRESEAKQYLLDKCADCDVYSAGQLMVQRIDAERVSYTNKKIEELKAQIKEEEARIKDNPSLGEAKSTCYTSFKVKRK